MEAKDVLDFVNAKWPNAMKSPLAKAVEALCAADEADRAAQFANLQAGASLSERIQVMADAMAHANACIEARKGWTVETLGNNIQSSFGPALSDEECDEIARAAIRKVQ